ncbi:MAG: DUF4192 family protein [Micrococcaceae bacterium]
MHDETITIAGIEGLITSLPGMLSYVPDNHLVLIVQSEAEDASVLRVGPVVSIEINEDLNTSTAQAMAAIIADAREYGRTIIEVKPIVITDDVHRRAQAVEFVDGFLVGLPIMPTVEAAHVHAVTPGAEITQGGDVMGHVGDWAATAVAAHAAYEGRQIRQSQDRWRAEGGLDERADQRRAYREHMENERKTD